MHPHIVMLQFCFFTCFRFLTLAWRGRLTQKWPATSWRAGIERPRSSSTGCTTHKLVNSLFSQFCVSGSVETGWESLFHNPDSLRKLTFALCCSGYLVGRLYHGRDAAGKTAVQRKWSYPYLVLSCADCKISLSYNESASQNTTQLPFRPVVHKYVSFNYIFLFFYCMCMLITAAL